MARFVFCDGCYDLIDLDKDTTWVDTDLTRPSNGIYTCEGCGESVLPTPIIPTHAAMIIQRLDKMVAQLEILTSPIEDEEEEPERYLDGTLME